MVRGYFSGKERDAETGLSPTQAAAELQTLQIVPDVFTPANPDQRDGTEAANGFMLSGFS